MRSSTFFIVTVLFVVCIARKPLDGDPRDPDSEWCREVFRGNQRHFGKDIQYTRREGENGGLLEEDMFARITLCTHNYFRKHAGLPLMGWNQGIAQFSRKYCQENDNAGCWGKHSSNDERKNHGGYQQIGENLFWRTSSGNVAETADWSDSDILADGEEAVRLWYEEIKFYGWSRSGDYLGCPMRNISMYPNEVPQVGHFTQVLWEKSTALGCDYQSCDQVTQPDGAGKRRLMIMCHYGKPGNVQGGQAFSYEVYVNLWNWAEENDRWGKIGWCE